MPQTETFVPQTDTYVRLTEFVYIMFKGLRWLPYSFLFVGSVCGSFFLKNGQFLPIGLFEALLDIIGTFGRNQRINQNNHGVLMKNPPVMITTSHYGEVNKIRDVIFGILYWPRSLEPNLGTTFAYFKNAQRLIRISFKKSPKNK